MNSRSLKRCREHLVKGAARHGLKLRQNYNRGAPSQRATDWPVRSHEAVQAHEQRIAHAAFARWTGLMRGVERQIASLANPDHAALIELIGCTNSE